MIGDDLAAALPELRAQAESMMRDTCTITGPGGAPVWNDATGTYDPAPGTTVYEGKCRVRSANPAPQTTDSGEAAWSVDHVVVSVPVDGTAGIADGHEVTITTCVNDPGMVGLVLSVSGGHFQTNSTARRLPCKVVSRDA